MSRSAGMVLLCAFLLAMSPPPPPRKVYVPVEAWCYTQWEPGYGWVKATPPLLYSGNGRVRWGSVEPGTCARIGGYTARSVVTLACEWQGQVAHSRPALDRPSPAFAVVCPVPAGQEFR